MIVIYDFVPAKGGGQAGVTTAHIGFWLWNDLASWRSVWIMPGTLTYADFAV